MKMKMVMLAGIMVATALNAAFAQAPNSGGALLAEPDGLTTPPLYKVDPGIHGNAIVGAGNPAGFVPEPSSIVLLCSGAAILFLRRRK
jgi:hypothetical protein